MQEEILIPSSSCSLLTKLLPLLMQPLHQRMPHLASMAVVMRASA